MPDDALEITPESAGWAFSGLRVLRSSGRADAFDTGEDELIVLPLEGGCDGDRRRRGVHAARAATACSPAPTDFVYAPRDARVEIARARRPLRAARPRARGPPASRATSPRRASPVELRGAGQASRQINNFCAPEAFAADRLIAVEVLTPGGNWSSYPPHKHDEDIPGVETALEEIYYFEVADGAASAYQRVVRPGRRSTCSRRSAPATRVLHAARLPRPVDGRARLRPLLPERDGRPGRARVALHATTRRTRGSATPGTDQDDRSATAADVAARRHA